MQKAVTQGGAGGARVLEYASYTSSIRRRNCFNHRQMLPYTMACGFVADAMSIPLATLIWPHNLRLKGMAMSWQYYLEVGLIITPPVLLATLGGLWLSMRLLSM